MSRTYTTDGTDIGQPPAAWIEVVRRAQLSRTVHSVAMTMASYADWTTGRDIHPGIARLSVDCKLTYKIVKAAVATLREVGLIELVSASTRPGWSDDYRLIFHPDLAERLAIRSPAEQKAEIVKVRAANRGKYRPKSDGDLRGTGSPAESAAPEEPAGYGVPAGSDSAGYGDADLRGTPLPPTIHAPIPDDATPQNGGDLRTDLTVVGAPAVDASIEMGGGCEPVSCGRRQCRNGFVSIGINKVRCHVCTVPESGEAA